MKKTFLLLFWMTGAACVHAAPTPVAPDFTHLPPAVQKTIMEAKGDGKLLGIAKKTEDGGLVFDVKVTKNGKPGTFTVSTDGSVSRQKIALPETPAPVQKAIQGKTIDAKLGDITKVTDDGDVTYEVEITQGKRDRDFTLDEDGEVVSELVFMDELTVAVQKTINEKAAGAELGDITRTFQDGEPVYEVDITRAGRNRYFAVDLDGTLLGEQVFLSELSPAIQATIKTQITGAKLGDINKVFGDTVVYEAAMEKNGAVRTFTVDEDGDLLDIQLPLGETPPPVQKTIQEQAQGSSLDQITKIIAGDEITYQVDLTTNDQARTFYVTAKGDLLGMEIAITDAPMAVQQALQAQIGTADLEKVIKNVDEGKVSYQADMSVDGRPRTVIMDEEGKLIYEQEGVALVETPQPVQKTVQLKLGATQPSSITKTLEDGAVSYEVEWTKDGKAQSVTLDDKGEDVALENK